MNQTEELQPAFEITIANSKQHIGTNVFNQLLLEAVDSAFAILGVQVSQAIYSFLKNNYSINREDIPYELGKFALALEELFGRSSQLIEIRIIQVLHQNAPSFKFYSSAEEFSLVNYVESLRVCL